MSKPMLRFVPMRMRKGDANIVLESFSVRDSPSIYCLTLIADVAFDLGSLEVLKRPYVPDGQHEQGPDAA